MAETGQRRDIIGTFKGVEATADEIERGAVLPAPFTKLVAGEITTLFGQLVVRGATHHTQSITTDVTVPSTPIKKKRSKGLWKRTALDNERPRCATLRLNRGAIMQAWVPVFWGAAATCALFTIFMMVAALGARDGKEAGFAFNAVLLLCLATGGLVGLAVYYQHS